MDAWTENVLLVGCNEDDTLERIDGLAVIGCSLFGEAVGFSVEGSILIGTFVLTVTIDWAVADSFGGDMVGWWDDELSVGTVVEGLYNGLKVGSPVEIVSVVVKGL
jgi:hypothetical protein